MKKIFYIIAAAMLFAACASKEYKIDGSIAGIPDGDTIALGYSVDGYDITIVDRAEVNNGRFTFTGSVNGSKIYYIAYENEEEPLYALFFLEPGEIKADIGEESFRITGTPANDLNTAIEDSLTYYVNEIQKIQFSFYADSLMSDSLENELTLQGLELQRDAMLLIKKNILANTNSIVSLFLLIQYADIFDDIEFSEIVNKIPEELKDRENNSLYDILKEMQFEREDARKRMDLENEVLDDEEMEAFRSALNGAAEAAAQE